MELCSASTPFLLQELRQRIRDSYEARWKAEKHFDEDQILNEMPGSLRIEVRATKPVKDNIDLLRAPAHLRLVCLSFWRLHMMTLMLGHALTVTLGNAINTVPALTLDAKLNNSNRVRQPYQVHRYLPEHLRQPF